ncbi:MAG: ABC transporter permease, partial [Spirochaetales bacterium]
MQSEMKKGFKYRVAANWDYFGLPGILILVVVIFSALSPAFRSAYSLMANFKYSALTAIAAIGMTFCITSGDFDISVGSMLALVSVLGATLAQRMNGVVAVLLVLALASFLGLVNGLFVTKLNIPAFITTLGMMFIYRAIAFIYTNNTPVPIKSPFWLF